MRIRFGLSLALTSVCWAAAAWAQGAAPAPAPEPPAAPQAVAPTAEPVVPPAPDPNAPMRQAYFDMAFDALSQGNLTLAEHAFSQAQALPGNPAMASVARSFAERTRQLAIQRGIAAAAARKQATGRTERITLFGITTAAGLGIYGWALPSALGIDSSNSSRAFVGTYMLTAAASFTVPYLLLRNAPITAAQDNLAFYGATRGAWHGVLVAALLAGDVDLNDHFRAWSAGMLLGSLGELVGGYHLARRANMSAGEARTMAAVGDFGLGVGFATGFLLGLDDKSTADGRARAMAAAGVVGSVAGLAGGYALARNRDNSWGDGEVLRASTALGVWTGVAAADVAEQRFDSNNRTLMALLLAGGTAGLVAGDQLVQRSEFSVGQAFIVDLSMVTGGLFAAGLTYLIGSKADDPPYLLTSDLGAILGFTVAYLGLHDTPEGPVTARLSRPGATQLALMPLVGVRGERGLALAGAF